MTDWADEEAAKLQIGVVTGDMMTVSIFVVDEIASALRAAFLRGRVAGLREAAEMCAEEFLLQHPMKPLGVVISSEPPAPARAAYFRAAADKLEKGEA